MSAPAIEISALPSLTPVLITGRDARKFLQGQLSNDVRQLSPRRGLLASCTSAQGRVLTVLSLIDRPEGLFALIPTHMLAPTLERLRRFILREQIELTDASQDWVLSALAPDDLAALAFPTCPSDPGECESLPEATLLRWWSAAPRALLLARRSAFRVQSAASQALAQAFHRAEIAAGLPTLYAGTRESFLPQTLNLDVLSGLSYDKGCYLGQETIARARRAQVKSRMQRFAAACAAPPAGTRVLHDGAQIGEVVDAESTAAASCELLAVTNVDVADSAVALQLDNSHQTVLTALELPYVTARARH